MKRFVTCFAIISPYLFLMLYLVIGTLTPGYNHFKHTISRLSIGQYGFWQSLNIVQFSIGIISLIYVSRLRIRSKKTATQLSNMLGGVALTLLLIAIFPTDPIDAFPKSIFSISWRALAHFGVLVLFILCTPILVKRLYEAFRQDTALNKLAPITLTCGIAMFTLSILWFLFFYFGMFNEYRGLFQKSMAAIVLYWIATITRNVMALPNKNC